MMYEDSPKGRIVIWIAKLDAGMQKSKWILMKRKHYSIRAENKKYEIL